MAELDPWEVAAKSTETLDPWEEARAKKEESTGYLNKALHGTYEAFKNDPVAAEKGLISSLGPKGISQFATQALSMVGDYAEAGLRARIGGGYKSNEEIKKNAEERAKKVEELWNSITDKNLVGNKSYQESSNFMDLPMIPGHVAADTVRPYSSEVASAIENANVLGMAYLGVKGGKAKPKVTDTFADIDNGRALDPLKDKLNELEAAKKFDKEFVGPRTLDPWEAAKQEKELGPVPRNETVPVEPETPYSRVAPEGFYSELPKDKGVPIEEKIITDRPLDVQMVDWESYKKMADAEEAKTAKESQPPAESVGKKWDDSGRPLITQVAETPHTDPITGQVRSKTIGDVISEVAKGHSEDHPVNISGWHESVLKRVGGWVKDIPVEFGKASDFDSLTAIATFDPRVGPYGKILLNPIPWKHAGNWNAFVHEVIHAATYTAINTYSRHPAVRGLGSIYKYLMQEGVANKDPVFKGLVAKYGMTNLHEFVAEVFTNPDFQKDLAHIKLPDNLIRTLDILHDESLNINPNLATKPGKFRSFLEATLTYITDLLGFQPHQKSAFIHSFRAGWDLMEGTASSDFRRYNTEAKARETGYPYIADDLMRPDYRDKYNSWKDSQRKRAASPLELREPELTTSSMLDNVEQKVASGEKLGEVKYVFNLSSESFRTVNALLTKGATLADRLLHHVGEKIRSAMQYENSLNHIAKSAVEAYSKHYVRGGMFPMIDIFKKDIGILVNIEKHPETWQDPANKWYPSAEKMVELGMSPESAKVWEGMHKLWASEWEILSNRAKENGITIPPRIPGYIPHFFRGAYAVTVKLVNIADPTDVKPYHEYNFDNKKQYQPLLDALNEQINGKIHSEGGAQYRMEVNLEKPSAEGNTAGRELQSLITASSREKLPMLERALEKIAKESAKGIISQVLERGTVTKVGHLAERVNMEGSRGLTHKQMKDAIQAFGTYHEAVNKFEARGKFVNETIIPMLERGFLDQDKGALATRTIDLANAYMGITPKFLSLLDTKLRDMAISVGMDPNTAARIINGSSRTASLFYLSLNPAYYIANMAQTLQAYPLLGNAAADLKARFGKDTSVTKALLSKVDTKTILEEAQKMGAIEPTQMEHMLNLEADSPVGNVTNMLSKPSTWVEKQTRKTSFVSGYKLASQVMSHQEALKYAAEYADKVSVPYSERAGAPLLFGMAPDALKPITMFLTYQQHQLGLLNNTIKLTIENSRQGDYAAASKAVSALVAVQAMNVGLFGLGGAAFAQLYDALAYMVDWPGVKELGRKFDRGFLDDVYSKMGLKGKSDLATFGAISEALGYDLSGSGSGVSISVSTAFPRFLQMVAQGAVLAGKFVGGKMNERWQPTDKEIWDWANTLPQNVRGYVEYALKHDKDSLIEVMTKANQDRRVGKDINLPLDGYRTTTEAKMRLAFGVLSTQERQQQLTENIDNMHEQKIKERVTQYNQLIKEHKFSSEEFNKAVNDLYTLAGQAPATTINIIKEFEKQKVMTQEERRFKGSTIGGMLPYQRYQKYQEQGGK